MEGDKQVEELMKSNNLDKVKCKLMDARAKCIMGKKRKAELTTRRIRKETEKGARICSKIYLNMSVFHFANLIYIHIAIMRVVEPSL